MKTTERMLNSSVFMLIAALAMGMMASSLFSQEINTEMMEFESSSNTSMYLVSATKPKTLINEIDDLMNATTQAEVVKSVPKIPGPNWTWPGMTSSSLESHLAGHHASDTTGLSFEDQRNLHDNLHNGYDSGTIQLVSSPVQQYQISTSSDGGCPGGVCPTRRPAATTVNRIVQTPAKVVQRSVQSTRNVVQSRPVRRTFFRLFRR